MVYDVGMNQAEYTWFVNVANNRAGLMQGVDESAEMLSAQLQAAALDPASANLDAIMTNIQTGVIQPINDARAGGTLTQGQAQSQLSNAQGAYDLVSKAQDNLDAGRTKQASNGLNAAANQLNALSNKISGML